MDLSHLREDGHDFSTTNDVGLASIIYLCLVQSLYFGLAGYELSWLVLEKYLHEQDSHHASANVVYSQYQTLASTILSTYLPAFVPLIGNNIRDRQWHQSYVPAQAVVDMFTTHTIVFQRLRINDDIFHSLYVKYLQATIDAVESPEEKETVGVSAVVQHYSTDGYQMTMPQMESSTTLPDVSTTTSGDAVDEEL